jgi:hypothetical protein
MSGQPRDRGRRPLGFVEIMLLILIVGIAVGLVLPMFQRTHTPSGYSYRRSNLRNLTLAMMAYNQEHGSLPPAAVRGADGKPLLSWRVLLLPYLEDAELHGRFKLDEPWDGPNNRKLLHPMPSPFRSRTRDEGEDQTFFRVFVGKGTAFEGPKGHQYPNDFPDGPSKTILIVEAAEAVP